MNISGDKKKLKTRDGHVIKRGDILYVIDTGTIKKFEVGFWNNGRKGNLYFNDADKRVREQGPYYVSLVGRGGQGVYPRDEDNVYCYYPVGRCFASFEKAREALVKMIEKEADTARKITEKSLRTLSEKWG